MSRIVTVYKREFNVSYLWTLISIVLVFAFKYVLKVAVVEKIFLTVLLLSVPYLIYSVLTRGSDFFPIKQYSWTGTSIYIQGHELKEMFTINKCKYIAKYKDENCEEFYKIIKSKDEFQNEFNKLVKAE